jgi:Family of unknown function (DUF6535)
MPEKKQEQSEFSDSSGPLFLLYRDVTKEEDNKMAERWQKDAEGILIFVGLFIFHTTSRIKSILQTGLFSAAVAALLAVTVLDLKQSSQDTAAFYLENMYKLQFLADSNTSRPSTPAQPPPFSAPKSAIWVNSLWFLSLCLSLTCAMLATLQQQWARRYLRVTQPQQSNPHDQARIRAFYAHGIDELRFTWVVEAVPTLIHISLFLFFAGLLIYLFNVNHPVFFAVVWWVGISAVVYLAVTFMPRFRLDSPYYTPLSSIIGSLRRMERTAEKTVRKGASKIDGRILKWSFNVYNTLADDRKLEKFFEKIPGFCNSKVVKNPHDSLAKLDSVEFSSALIGFLSRTSLSNSLSESDKMRRFDICVKAADAARLPRAVWQILDTTFYGKWNSILQSVQAAYSLKCRDNSMDKETNLCAQWVVAGTIANVQGEDNDWIALAADQLGKSERVVRGYLAHGDSVLLAVLIHITRQIFNLLSSGDNQEMADAASHNVLTLLRKFGIEVQGTLPGLQHEFCALWNDIVTKVQEGGASSSRTSRILILKFVRHLYVTLHQGTAAAPTEFSDSTDDHDHVLDIPTSYPLCDIQGHGH